MLFRYGCVILKKSFEVFDAYIDSPSDLDGRDLVSFEPSADGAWCHFHDSGDVPCCEKLYYIVLLHHTVP